MVRMITNISFTAVPERDLSRFRVIPHHTPVTPYPTFVILNLIQDLREAHHITPHFFAKKEDGPFEIVSLALPKQALDTTYTGSIL